MLFSDGHLHYSFYADGAHKVILTVDPELVRYCLSRIPKWVDPQRQKYPPHISVVRKEIPTNLDAWGKYENELIAFTYEPITWTDHKYVWFDCYSDRLQEIRVELGLPPYRGTFESFHCSIGNYK